MSKTAPRKNFIDDPQRCEICSTTLTLYPKDFAACPHCEKRICRHCWGNVWAAKGFSAESCLHLLQPDGVSMAGVSAKRALNWDWQKIAFMLVLLALAGGTLVFIFNLFVF